MSDASDEPSAVGFFKDPAMDRFAAAFLRLMSEQWAQTERLSSLIDALERRGLLEPGDVERIGRASDSDAGLDAAATEFSRRVLGPLREASGG